MTTPVRRGLLILLVLFLGLQLYRPERSNPPVDPGQRLQITVPVPADVQGLLQRACADCHSNETRWPWYTHVSPVSWLLARDVREGRAHWNMSRWTYSTEESAEILEDMCEEVRAGAMPLPVYTFIHRDAVPTPEEIDRLCQWTNQAIDRLFASH